MSLPDDIIEEILSRLAVKQLLKLRCVSKSWRSLIDSEGFIKTHYQKSLKTPSFPHQRAIIHYARHRPMQWALQSLLNERPATYSSPLDVPTNTNWRWVQTVGCCNGLVCIIEHFTNFYVWNPSTRIAKNLPEVTGCGLVMNPGFGWVESSREYKVFGVFIDEKMRVPEAKVYSSKTNSWKTLTEWDSPVSVSSFSEGICVDEKLHWVYEKFLHWHRGQYMFSDIYVFDLKSEVFGMMELPYYQDCWVSPSLGEIGGCLCVLYECKKGGVRVRVMKEYGVKESWVSLARVLDLVERPFSAPLIEGANGEILVFFGSAFLVYYPRHNVYRFPNLFYECGCGPGLFYVESLVSP